MSLQGADQLRSRLRAIEHTGQRYGQEVGRPLVREIAQRIPVRTGETRHSVRLGSSSDTHTTVVGSKVVTILDKGAKAHVIRPDKARFLRFQAGGRTIFAKAVHHPRSAGRGIIGQAFAAVTKRVSLERLVVDAWNKAG